MKNLFSSLDDSLVLYWKKHSLDENSFYCRACGNLMLDISQIDVLKYDPVKDDFYHETFSNKSKTRKRYGYNENETNRWLVKGRTLSGKTFFRRLCWDCFFKQLRATIDIQRKARKGKWYAKIKDGANIIPAASTSPSKEVFSLLFDITDEELEQERIKFATGTLESKIMRFGKEEGTRRWNEYRKRQAYTCSKEYMQKTRGYTDEEWKQFNHSRATTKENFILRYGEAEGIRRWDKYCAYEAYAGSSLLWFIDKYGEEEGKRKYKEICEKKEASKGYSFVSQEMFEAIDKKLGIVALPSRWEKKNHEYEIIAPYDVNFIKVHSDVISNVDSSVGINLIDVFKDDDVKMVKFRPDYVLGKRIIEFNGDFWHANPAIYGPDDVLEMFNKTYEVAKNIWERDACRLDILKALGFQVYVVWEADYGSDPDRVVEECVKFLKGG